MKPFLLFCFFSFALTACVGQDVKPLSTTEKPTPDWFLNPPSDTTRQLYGVGEGRTREEAVQAALVDIAAKLSVQVSAISKAVCRSRNPRMNTRNALRRNKFNPRWQKFSCGIIRSNVQSVWVTARRWHWWGWIVRPCSRIYDVSRMRKCRRCKRPKAPIRKTVL